MTAVAPAPPVKDWCEVAAQAASAKKGADTVILDMGPLLEITDAFVITSGANPRQIRSICEEVELRLKRAGGPRPLSVEGLDDTSWVLMDYGDFVVHVFAEETRAFYELERLWANAERWDWADIAAEELVAAAE
ncbi:MAG TPA: ribosome silencing factor [Acidimicrobiales bacterium]|nr:ribosome silencing factor [Acidimicrobiales bacterium]